MQTVHLAALLLCTQAATLVFVLDVQTPPQLSHLISSWSHHPTWLVTNVSSFFYVMTSRDDVIGVLDGTFSVSQTEAIEAVSGDMDVPVLVLGYTRNRPKTPLHFHLRGNFTQVAEAVQTLLGYFGWTQVSLVLDTSEASGAVSRCLSSGNVTFDKVVLGLSDKMDIDRLVGRSLRLKGNRISVLSCSPDVAKLILDAQHRLQIGGVGFGNILVMDSGFLDINAEDPVTVKTGNLIIVEEGLEQISGLQDYYSEILAQALSFYEHYMDQSSLLAVLQRKYPSNIRPAVFSLLSVQNGVRVQVGRISASCDVFAPVYFLGNSTVVPENAPSSIPLSANFGVRNAHSYVLPVLNYYYGTVLALADINRRRDVLEAFTLELYNFTAGVQQWDFQFAYDNVFPNLQKLGLVVFTSASSALTVHLFDFLRSLNYTGPLIGAANTVNALSSKACFPGYLRTVVPDSANIVVYVQMFKRYGWKQCGLFVSNEIWGLGFREGFVAQAKSNGIEVVNSPELQILPTPIASVDVLRQNWTANFLDFINTKARILLLVVNNNAVMVIDYLYELGLRKGDLQVLACEMLSESLISTSDPVLAYSRSQLLEGAVQFSPLTYVGALGADVQQRLRQYSPEPPLYACLYYDAGLAVGYAFDLLVNLGADFADPTLFLQIIKGSKFVGCSGTVTFSLDSNDRTEMNYAIFNARSNGTCITSIVPVGVYSPTSVEMFHFDQDIVWSGGSTPTDRRDMVPGCPFEQKYDAAFPAGQYFLYQVSSAYFLYLILICVLLCRCAWTVSLTELTSKQQFEFLDAVAYWEMALEMGQYIGLGPSPSFFPYFVRVFFAFVVVDLDYLNVIDQYETLLWGLTGVCVVTLGVWAVLLFQLDQRCKALGDLAELMVWLSAWMFLPIAQVLCTVFVCVRCNGAVDYEHSYLQADCQLSCWQGRHLPLVAVAGALLLFYVPLAVALRPIWQGLFEHVNIQTSPRFLICKSVYQIGIVLLKSALKSLYPVWFAVLFMVSEGLFIVLSLLMQTLSYHRARLWLRVSVCAALWTSALTLLQDTLHSDVLLGLWLGGGLLLAAVGGLYQRLQLPSLLEHQEGVDTMQLFRFAFQRTNIGVLTALHSSFSAVHHPSTVQVPDTSRPTSKDRSDSVLTVSHS